MTEREAVNMRLSKQRLTAWLNVFINMKAQNMRSKGSGFAKYFDLIYYNKGKKDEKVHVWTRACDVINEEIRL